MANNGDDPSIIPTAHRFGGVAPKTVVGYAVDTKARKLLVQARGALDVEPVLVAMSYGQLKHIVGQLITQEGEGELTGQLAIVPLKLPEGKPD